jgi:hypothetical protein
LEGFFLSLQVSKTLKQTGFAKAVVAAAQRISGGLPNDDVIEEADIDGKGGFTELPGDLNIRCAGSRIAAGVIVHAKDGGGAVPDGFAKYLARVGEAAGGGTRGNFHLFN